MTQQEVLKVLEKQQKWMTAKEIAKITGDNDSCVARCLAKMFKYREVFRKNLNEPKFHWASRIGPYLWKSK